jgi:hypothetical protein
VSARIDWLKAFPQDEANIAVRFLCQLWNELAISRAEGFTAAVSEPDLTFVLTEKLKDMARHRAKLRGRWGQESQGGEVDPTTLRIRKRYRTDIEYFTDRYDPALRLIFEFKKLSDNETTRGKYYGDSGMMRFVVGNYSIGDPVALMVGILMDEDAPTVTGLRRALHLPAVRGPLAMVKTQRDEYFREPSSLFPESARFDTDHVRDANKAPAHQTIRIAHVFVGFPDPPPAPRRRRRKALTREAIESSVG